MLARTPRRPTTKLDEDDKAFFDTEKLTNPYSTRASVSGDPETGSARTDRGHRHGGRRGLLADRLREKGAPIDLILAHHPGGSGFADLHEVMCMQADLWARQGVSIAAG